MSPLRTLLAAVDDSGAARHAAERAARLAAQHDAELHLLHVLPQTLLDDLRDWLGSEHAAQQALRDDTRVRLDHLARDLGALAKRTVHAQLREGKVLQCIGDAADALAADLLVLGSRGSGMLTRLALGSTAERMLRRSTGPLLIVRQKPRTDYQRVLVAVDFSPWSASTLALARRLAPAARLCLIHVFAVPFEGKLRLAGVDEASIARYREHARLEAQRSVRELAEAAGLDAGDHDLVILEGDASRQILEQEEEQDTDLIVLGKQGRSAAETFLLGSVTKHVLAHCSSDVLVCPIRQASVAEVVPSP